MFLILKGSECCRMKARQNMKQADDNKQETGWGRVHGVSVHKTAKGVGEKGEFNRI